MSLNRRSVFHFLAAVHYWFSCYYDWNYVKIPADVHRMGRTFGKTNKLKFLTYWDALLQAFFFTICFVCDVIEKKESEQELGRRSSLMKLKHALMTCLAFPLSMFVGLTFWGLYLVDRELVLPKAVDAFFPTWLNHCMHTNIMIFILIEMATTFYIYPRRKTGMTILISFMVVYLIWIHIIFSQTGVWVYPVLDVLSFPFRLVFFGSLLTLAMILYIAGEKLNSILWKEKSKLLKAN